MLQSAGDAPGALPKDEEAEGFFQNAGAVAHDQGSRSLELRAALSLARLWQRQDKADAAHRMLSGIHGLFTEGFDTADWQEAQALLASLA